MEWKPISEHPGTSDPVVAYRCYVFMGETYHEYEVVQFDASRPDFPWETNYSGNREKDFYSHYSPLSRPGE